MEPLKPSQKNILENKNPYPLTDNGNEVYSFISDYNINYGIRFKNEIVLEVLEEQNFEVSEFEFLAGVGRKTVRDERVSTTVIQALKNYLDNPLKVIVYICDEEGNRRRGDYRQILFREWYNKMGEGFKLYTFNPKVESLLGTYELSAGVIYRNDCPKIDVLVSTVNAAAPDIIREKYFEEDIGSE